MVTLLEPPVGLDQIIDEFGNPDRNGDWILDPEFYECRTTVLRLPFPLRISWGDHRLIERIRCHTDIGCVLVDALEEIKAFRGVEYLQGNGYDFFGGCFNFRPTRGASGRLSTHAWGIAIDINPQLGPLGKPSRQPKFIVRAFTRRGFQWGGEWSRPDGMHFQACKGY
jgi:hypothetical protein